MSELCLPRKTWFSSLLISDLKQFCSFLLSQPLYLSYFVFFSPYLLKILSFLFPLVFTTSLLLLAFLTVSPGLIRKFLPHSKVGDLLSACHTLVEDGTQECFDLEDFEAYKIVFEGPITDVQESQAQFSEQSLVENSMESMTQEAELNVSVLYTPARQNIWNDINQDNSVTQQTELNVGTHKELVGELESMGSVKGDKKVEAQGANADKVVENQKARNGSEDEEANVNKTKTKPKTKTPITGNDSQSPKVESSRTLDYNLVSNGSMRKEKEWKRTLACKLYEERNTRDALKFSAGKVNLGMGIGKPNLMKISKAIKGFGWLHHVSSKHSKKVHIEDRL
nr:uncharacterized protein LOC109182633 [Ipomoea batatas]